MSGLLLILLISSVAPQALDCWAWYANNPLASRTSPVPAECLGDTYVYPFPSVCVRVYPPPPNMCENTTSPVTGNCTMARDPRSTRTQVTCCFCYFFKDRTTEPRTCSYYFGLYGPNDPHIPGECRGDEFASRRSSLCVPSEGLNETLHCLGVKSPDFGGPCLPSIRLVNNVRQTCCNCLYFPTTRTPQTPRPTVPTNGDITNISTLEQAMLILVGVVAALILCFFCCTVLIRTTRKPR